MSIGANEMSTTGHIPSCPYCGGLPHDHVEQCPNIKSVEYFPNGVIKRVEKHTPSGVGAVLELGWSDRHGSGGIGD